MSTHSHFCAYNANCDNNNDNNNTFFWIDAFFNSIFMSSGGCILFFFWFNFAFLFLWLSIEMLIHYSIAIWIIHVRSSSSYNSVIFFSLACLFVWCLSFSSYTHTHTHTFIHWRWRRRWRRPQNVYKSLSNDYNFHCWNRRCHYRRRK